MKLCPKCKSDEIMLDTGGQTGKYKCKKCGYIGSLVIEEGDASLDEVEETKKNDKSVFYSLIFIGVFVLVLVLILGGIQLFKPETKDDWINEILEKGETEHGYMYNGFVFVNYDDLWHTKLQKGDSVYNLHFHYSPAHVDQVPVLGSLDPSLDTSKFYVTFDPLEKNVSLIGVAMSELSLNLVRGLGTKITPACYRNETLGCYNRPIITCSNTDKAVFFVKSGEETKVTLAGNCIVLEGPGEDIFKAVDKALFDFYGIIEQKI
jgi:hypothetical protein